MLKNFCLKVGEGKGVAKSNPSKENSTTSYENAEILVLAFDSFVSTAKAKETFLHFPLFLQPKKQIKERYKFACRGKKSKWKRMGKHEMRYVTGFLKGSAVICMVGEFLFF